METAGLAKTDVVKLIREELRESACTERKENRTKILNKNRVTLGSIVTNSSFTVDFVVKKAKELKKKSLTIEEYKQLQNALLQSEENVNAFLKVDNILYAVVRDFCRNDQALQLCAVSCACNLALGNVKACTALTKSIGPYLVTKCDTLNYPLLEACLLTMGNLVTGSDKAFEILHAQGALKCVISLTHNCDETILLSVAYAAVHYLHVGHQYIGEDAITELAKAISKRTLSFETPYFIWLIALLSSRISCIPYLYNIIPFSIDYLYQNGTNKQLLVSEITACVRILANAVQESSGQLAMLLLKHPDTETLLNKLLSCNYVHLRKETLWLIGNLYNHNFADVRNIIQSIIPRLSSLGQAILSTTRSIESMYADSTS